MVRVECLDQIGERILLGPDGRPPPASDILNCIAKALDTTTDFLMNGTMQDKSAEAISDLELLSQFRKVEKLPAEKKKLVKEFLDAFIFKADLQKQLAPSKNKALV